MTSIRRAFSKVPRHLLRLLIAGLVVIVIGLQFVRPAIKNEPVTAELSAPPQVRQILRTACYDCHSNETNLSWFDQIVPAYWLVASDVRKARSHLNFSELAAMPAVPQKEALFEAINQIQSGDMPPRSYQMFHGDSKVNSDQLAVLKAFLDPYRKMAPESKEGFAAVDSELKAWIETNNLKPLVKPAPNGIAFIPEYKDWEMISSTERLDNQTIRLVLGNDIAIGALEANDINPWPDGTIFAKVAWNRLTDDQGQTQLGQFKQVEFMIKDSKNYASTLGWGFARWRGVDLKPFGQDSNFVQGCVGCHRPMRENDFVFTRPIKGEK